jgi:hypothetical protein
MFTTRDEDVEFKKLLWTCVLYIVRDSGNEIGHQSVVQRDFLSAILMYIDPSNSGFTANRWQPPQLKEIQIHGLSVLSSMIVLVPEHFH